VDVRVVAATNRNLKDMVERGEFREDLYFRLNEYHIHIPPLRRRPKDILPLAHFFLRRHTIKNNKQVDDIAPELCKALERYSFPGNVRELENIIASAVLVEESRQLTLGSAQTIAHPQAMAEPSESEHFPTLTEVQDAHILRALKHTNGNRTHAAQVLGIGLRTLQRKLKRLSVSPTTSN
jgi:transcriptional regulator with PAS, ATPase and Fis domain